MGADVVVAHQDGDQLPPAPVPLRVQQLDEAPCLLDEGEAGGAGAGQVQVVAGAGLVPRPGVGGAARQPRVEQLEDVGERGGGAPAAHRAHREGDAAVLLAGVEQVGGVSACNTGCRDGDNAAVWRLLY